MPYTPPAKISPLACEPDSPTMARSLPFTDRLSHTPTLASSPPGRPNPPRSPSSTSYLTRHRRTPSMAKAANASSPEARTSRDRSLGVLTPSKDASRDVTSNGELDPARSESIRQSPPPRSKASMPPGAVMSPPDSRQTSSDDDEGTSDKRRGRQLDNLAELTEAIRNIERERGRFPDGEMAEWSGRSDGMDSDPTSPLQQTAPAPWRDDHGSARAPLSREARKISHSRSSTDGAIVFDNGAKTPSSVDDDNNDSDVTESPPSPRPSMVRKKSGELVKPALRPASRRRPSSMPGTPTLNKAVHFDAHLEHVRHFLKIDRPLAVSAGSSPVEGFDGEGEYPFGPDEPGNSRRSPYDWEIILSNFPLETAARLALPVRVERVYLSKDKGSLIGAVAVANLAFHKAVVARFTFDYWKTTSEIVAEYDHHVRGRVDDGYDRFHFVIKLSDQAKLENKTLFFCVRYNVAGQEFWDNNSSMNFQVVFVKKAPAHGAMSGGGGGGLGARPAHAIPRTRSVTGRPWSMPVAASDDFGDYNSAWSEFGSFRASSKLAGEAMYATDSDQDSSGEGPLPEMPRRRTGHGGGQAFGSRYDFGASLSAAIQAAANHGEQRRFSKRGDDDDDADDDARKRHGSGNRRPVLSRHTTTPAMPVPAASASTKAPATTTVSNGTTAAGSSSSSSSKDVVLGGSPPAKSKPSSTTTTNQTFSRPETYISEKPSLHSPTYLELIDKYCFVRSGTPARIATTAGTT